MILNFLKTASQLKYFLLALTATLLFSCTRLPEYGHPQFNEGVYSEEVKLNGFKYRQLTRKDFQAVSPPPGPAEQKEHLQARSCLNIRPSSNAKVHITRTSRNGSFFYIGSISEVSFEALFLPKCSWWNPKLPEKKYSYVLQHEQIHFAIAELKARELTEKVGEEMRRYITYGDDKDEVKKNLLEKLQEIADIARKSIKDGLEEHLAFDNETSMTLTPKAQHKWLLEIESKLSSTSLKAAP